MKCDHDHNCWCELLEHVEFKQVENPKPLPAFKSIIMTGGQTSTPDKNPSKRYFKDASECLKEDPRKIGLMNCNNLLGEKSVTASGLDRKDNNKGYVSDNICSCCWICNSIKGEHISFEEMKEVISLILKMRKIQE